MDKSEPVQTVSCDYFLLDRGCWGSILEQRHLAFQLPSPVCIYHKNTGTIHFKRFHARTGFASQSL